MTRLGGLVKAVEIQVLAYAPTVFFHCQHCEIAFGRTSVAATAHREQAREALPDDLREQFQDLSNWVHELAERFGGRIRVVIVDAASIEGVLKSLRYRIRKYPAVIVAGAKVQVGTDFQALTPVIERHVAAASAPT
ncbi:MAG: hypothetical protein ACRDJV_03840 [Actinomycetota bacterium]